MMSAPKTSTGTLSVAVFLAACWLLFFLLIYEGTASRESWMVRSTMVIQGMIVLLVLAFSVLIIKKLYG